MTLEDIAKRLELRAGDTSSVYVLSAVEAGLLACVVREVLALRGGVLLVDRSSGTILDARDTTDSALAEMINKSNPL